ncbi:DUF2848 family protein [Aneurinibacillus thermoaerophilus]|uniref:DUF2848 family protein n=1 Tax=Aneurinibacillus thermoaerophilus TaxID=143495 RepID=UPI002E1A4957|nr:DUF2848 family protein [Aneurinibacillus thermoaerophilus]
MKEISVTIDLGNGDKRQETFQVSNVIVVGYGGRNIEKVMEHIHELEQIGVSPPSTIPAIYPQKLSSLTFNDSIRVNGGETSGEAEYVLFNDGNEWFVTVGSDHTDRLIEKEDIQKSKEACPKPLATLFWKLKDVEQHWDELILRSWITDNTGRRMYQENNLTALLPVHELLDKLREFGYENLSNTIIFSGTVPTLEGFVYGSKFEYELEDPVLNRIIRDEYSIVVEEVSAL